MGKWLKVTVTYEDGFGPGKTAEGATRQPVLSQPHVSNMGSDTATGYALESFGDFHHIAQAFTTGGDPEGYLLSGLRFGFGVDKRVHQLSWTLHDHSDRDRPAEEPLFAPIAVDPETLDQQ